MFKLFIRLVKVLTGSGLSRLPWIISIYEFLYNNLAPQSGIEIKQVDRFRIFLDTRDVGDVTPPLLYGGVYKKEKLEIIKEEAKPGMVCVDVGATLGYFSLFMAERVGLEGAVYAFEPEQHNYNLMVRTFNENGFSSIIPVRKAVSNIDEKRTLFASTVHHGSHTLKRASNARENGFGQMEEEVEVTTLDSYFGSAKVDFVKLDAGGAEELALEGMESLIENNEHMAILIGFGPEPLSRFGSTPRSVVERLKRYGFGIEKEIRFGKEAYTNLLVRK